MMKTSKRFKLVCILPAVLLFHATESLADNNNYIMFLATNGGNGYHGNLISSGYPQDVGKIDEICNSSLDAPADHSGFQRRYKAMIGSGYRYPVSPLKKVNKNWVMQPETSYYDQNGVKYGTSNSNQVFGLALENALSGSDTRVWTGFNADWSIADNSCKQWTNKNGDNNGRVGLANSTSPEKMISYEGKHCDGHGMLYCVMQPTTVMLQPIPGGSWYTSSSQPITINFTNQSGVMQSSVSGATITVTAESSTEPLVGHTTYLSESTYQYWHAESLIPNTKYIVAVTGVQDKNGLTIPTAKFTFTASAITSPNIMFVTRGSWHGVDVGGISGADYKCNTEAAATLGLPSGIYKAMLLNDRASRYSHFTRTSVESAGWVLKPNTQYVNINSEKIGTTNSLAVFEGNLAAHIYDVDGVTTYQRAWTGMQANWTPQAGDTCDGWSGNSGQGAFGAANSLLISEVIHYSTNACTHDNDKEDSEAHLYCVRQ